MMKKIFLGLLLATLAFGNSYAAGKVYAVIMGATNDSKIGISCKTDLDRFQNEVATLALNLDLDQVPTIRLDGNNCDRQHMEQAFNQLRSATSQDIVFFYYTGHGGRASNDKTKWPQMCMNYREQGKFVPVHEVITQISQLSAHLKIILTDCCNKIDNAIAPKFIMAQSKGATDVSEVNYQNLEKLFIHQNGTIIATSSQVDEYSIGINDDKYGGLFSFCFWKTMEAVEANAIEPTWSSFFTTAVSFTKKLSEGSQTPIYDISSATSTTPTTTHTPSPTPSAVGNASVNQSMLSAITGLLNRNTDINSRVRMVDGIVSNYFSSSNVYVQTVGRDMVTIVDTEDVATFLRRMCFDKKIRQINVITEDKDASGRCKYLKVHEVRDELGR